MIGEELAPKSEAQESARAAAFMPLYASAQHRIYACILALLPDAADADEVLQETSLILWQKFEEFRPDGDFARWACGIAYNQARRHRRERARAGMQFDDAVLDRIAAGHQQQIDYLESRRLALSDCLKKLRGSDRDLLARTYAADTTLKSVAQQLGRPVNTVYKAIQRIRLTLLECVDRSLRREEAG